MTEPKQSCLIDFFAKCRCGWNYGPGLQSDVTQQAKFHRKGCGKEGDGRRAMYAS